MAKQKTKRGWAKRVKKRKSGKISRRRAGKGHLLTSKSKKRKRRLRQATELSKADTKRLKGLIV
ncbi:50S ribosomal protein L35 [candidate division WOR-3 bacterium]|jgi:large subunit ribosomal protein L35|nr:50S ribosomal protein L35 [candidate division WOR-3 bacterium]MCK4672393.1 50S ribosomal protein L35 [candidate division WOR-3 bacterium]NOR18113.1 50S ribosomal protein L35 [candidate division WOR-3 bacterium]